MDSHTHTHTQSFIESDLSFICSGLVKISVCWISTYSVLCDFINRLAVTNGIAAMDSVAIMTGSSNTIVGFVVSPHQNKKDSYAK